MGKTTVGRHLASHIGFTFHDTDRVIEQRAGADISWIFELEGEERFRDREQQVIEEMTQRQGIVLATGGGAVLRERNRALLRERGVVVYLRGAASTSSSNAPGTTVADRFFKSTTCANRSSR